VDEERARVNEDQPADIDAEAVAERDHDASAPDSPDQPADAAISEGLADWLARVRRFAPGLLHGTDSARVEAPPDVPHGVQPIERVALDSGAGEPASEPRAVAPVVDMQHATVPPVSVQQTRVQADIAGPVDDTAEPRARERQRDADAVSAYVGHDTEPLPEWPALDDEEPAEPEYFTWPPAASHESAEVGVPAEVVEVPEQPSPLPTVQQATSVSAPLAPISFTGAKSSRRPDEPWPEITTPGSHETPADWPTPTLRLATPPVPVAGPPVATRQPLSPEPAAAVWVSPWPTLPDPAPADDSEFEVTLALNERDRWARLLKEQESA